MISSSIMPKSWRNHARWRRGSPQPRVWPSHRRLGPFFHFEPRESADTTRMRIFRDEYFTYGSGLENCMNESRTGSGKEHIWQNGLVETPNQGYVLAALLNTGHVSVNRISRRSVSTEERENMPIRSLSTIREEEGDVLPAIDGDSPLLLATKQ